MSDQIPVHIQNSVPETDGDVHMTQPTSEQSFGQYQQQQQQQQQHAPFQFGMSAHPTETLFHSEENHTPAPQQEFDLQNTESHTQDQRTLEEMEQEAAKLRELNSELDNLQQSAQGQGQGQGEIDAQRSEADSKSVYVGNVDYGTTPLELQQHFSTAGVVERVTIMTNKQTGQPKGFAYLEFALADGANKAVATLDGSAFRDRELKVNLKRTNIPGLSASSRGGFRGRGRGRGMMRGRGRGGFRGRGGMRGGPRFSPY